MSAATVSANYDEGNVVTIAPKNTEKNFELYNVVRRLQNVHSGAIILHFYRCEICEEVLKVNTMNSHAKLTRHFAKCSGPGKF